MSGNCPGGTPISSAIAPNQTAADHVVQHVVAVVGPEGHLPLRVVHAVQRPPPAEHVLEPVPPVLAEIQDHDIERAAPAAAWSRSSGNSVSSVGGTKPASASQPVPAACRRGQQHEGEQRQHAEPREQRVEHVGAHRAAVGHGSTGRQASSGRQTA